MNPAKLQAMLQAAIVHHRAGRFNEAEALYRPLRVAAPKNFDVLHLSGLVAYQQERTVQAVDWLRRALRINPKDPICEMRLALALLASGDAVEAEKHLRHALQLDPKFSEAWDNLAYLLKTKDRLTEALGCHEKAVTLKPTHAVAWYNYGLTLSLLGRYAEALKCHDRALAADPKYALARFGRAQALHQADRVREAVADYREFLRVSPNNHEARSFLLFGLHAIDEMTREEIFAEHLEYGRAVGSAVVASCPNSADPARRLRVAVLSPDLRMHSCAYFIEPLFRYLDREQFELYLYHDHFREDAVSARLRSLATVWRNFISLPAATVEQTIRQDAPDILIDLAGHTGMTNRLPLIAKRLAPVQVTYLGYPDTTGVPAMDYRFTDNWADPAGESDEFATEKLIRFSTTAWTYSPPEDAPVPERVGPNVGLFTFGCFNAPSKISDRVLSLWARVMEAVPDSRLLLKGAGFGEPAVRAAYFERLARLGLVVDRVGLVERTPDTQSHLAMYQLVDVALDTFPYHGTTTTCEALWMGVPVVVFAGDRHMSRVGVSLLHAAGHPEWIGQTAEDYVRIASGLAADVDTRRRLRSALRDDLRRGPLMDYKGQAERFGAALRNCWVTWCGAESRGGGLNR
jgi:protein O-GlcNAc transferase